MTLQKPLPGTKRACVIGAGLSGLALAIRLQAAGIQTLVVEARSAPGGMATSERRDGFTFCSGPTALADRNAIDELWALCGTTVEHDLPLLPVEPLSRFSWPDGGTFDLTVDDAVLTREIARIAPGDLAGYDEYLRVARAILSDFRARPGPAPFAGPRDLALAMPLLARHQAWRTLASLIAHHIKSERLREVLAVPALMGGANPYSASALLAADHARERAGLWWPEGGIGLLAEKLAGRFAALGGTIRLNDPVVHVHAMGNRAHEVETQSGWRDRFSAIASTADRDHTWRDLLGGTSRGAELAARTRRLRHAPGLFTVHFALEGTWPGIPHRMVLFGPRFRALIDDIYEHGVLPQDQMIWLGHPSVTDPTLAPPGKSVFQAGVPVPNLGQLPIDWEAVGPMLERRVLAEIGRRLVPDIEDRLIVHFHTTPRDLALEFNAARGTGFGIDPPPLYRGWQGEVIRDKAFANVYLAGVAAAPGGGLTGALAAARTCATTMLEDLS
ncbi:MAG: phytoene desaturase [Sphingomonadales bacterium]|nr:phytoene desaturase [Sphingomonadales bacterium]